MITFTNTVEIGRSADDVYHYLADLSNIPEWNWAIESTEPTSRGPIVVGATFRQVRHTPMRSVEELQIAELVAGERIVISGQLGPFDATIVYELRPARDGTVIDNTMTLQASGPARLLGSVLASTVSRSVAANLAELKRLLESERQPTMIGRPDRIELETGR